MTFILSKDGRHDDARGAFERYRHYLKDCKDRFPPNAYALANSDWYFNFHDHRSPHDAWMEQLQLTEAPSPDQRRGVRHLSITLRLLGAFHDGHIELRYPQVLSYSLSLDRGNNGHRDWRYDELRVGDTGTLIHEIEWWDASETGSWIIEATDLEFRWLPLAKHPTSKDAFP